MKRLLHIFILVCISVSVFADEVSLRVSAPSTVEVGGKFRVQFTVNTQNVSHFSAPDFKGFEVIYGPATSSQSSFQMINGRTSQSSSIIYTYVLMAESVGVCSTALESRCGWNLGSHENSLPMRRKSIPAAESMSQISSTARLV